jgi:hypothetical protein
MAGNSTQRVVVVWVECVAVVSPVGATVVPLDVDAVLVTTPLTVVVFSLCVSTDEGDGATGVVVCMVVVLDEEDCAKALPVIRATAIVGTSKCLIMLRFSRDQVRAGIACLVALFSDIDDFAAGSETTQSLLAPYLCQPPLSPRSE